MRNEIQSRTEQAIREKVFPGCVIGFVKKSGDREMFPFGKLTYEPDSPKVVGDTVYDLASVTKSIPVASLALTFIAEEKLQLTDKVTNYIPELQNDYGATIQDILTYRVRGTRLSELSHRTCEEVRMHILEHGFDGPAGERVYTNLPAYVLGLVLERVGGGSLAELSHRYFFEPLKMESTTFFPSPSDCAPTEIIEGEEICGVVHDESARVFSRARRTVGHAGLFSTAPDILHFLESLLQGVHPAIVEGGQRGLGWQKAEAWFMGERWSEGAFGKTGFTGTSVAVDFRRGIALVILSNRTYPQRPADAASIHSAINNFRADTADLILR